MVAWPHWPHDEYFPILVPGPGPIQWFEIEETSVGVLERLVLIVRARHINLIVDNVMHIRWCNRLHWSEKVFKNYKDLVFKFLEHETVIVLIETIISGQHTSTNLHGELYV